MENEFQCSSAASFDVSVQTTIVQLKRKLGVESSDTIVISAKRKCLNQPNNFPPVVLSTVLTKLATIDKNEKLVKELEKALNSESKCSLSEELKRNYKKGPKSRKKRAALDTERDESRFRNICFKRNLLVEKSGGSGNIIIFDAFEKDEAPLKFQDVVTCNGEPMESKQVQYVYDLYVTHNPVEHSSWLENICEIRAQSSGELVCEEGAEDSDSVESEDDENAEENWRNDYPDEDEDPLLYEDEDDYLIRELSRTKIDDDSSYDGSDYDEEGDFDEGGNLIAYGGVSTFKIFHPKKWKQKDDDGDSSSSEGEET